jgi:membrane-bound inhibitor of C-type lysozyme
MAWRILSAAVLIVAASAGCDHPDPTMDYFCSDSRSLSVTYFNAPAPGRARLVAGDETYELPRSIGAKGEDGARFSDGKIDWWEHGGKAEFSREGASTECVELP